MDCNEQRPMVRGSLRSALTRMTGDGVAFSVMVGAGETYIPAFALALGMSDAETGLLATVPMAAGGLIQLAAPRATRRFGYRPVVLAGAALQALSFVPLVIGALVGALPPWLLFACAAAYWAAGLSTTGAWSAWAGRLVPSTVRSAYFGRRQGLMQFGVLAGLVGAGMVLELGYAWPLLSFAAVFALASVARATSVGYLLGYPKTASTATGVDKGGAGVARVRGAWASAERPWMLLVVALHMSVSIAGPFFTPFMLGPASLSYGEYTVLVSAVFVAKVFALPVLGRRARGRSATGLVATSALGVATTPILWLVSDDFWFLLGAQLLGGLFWAGVELGIQLGFFALSCDDERAGLVSLYNAFHSVGAAVATALGALLFTALGADRGAFHALFAVSSAARFLAASLLIAHARGLSLAIWNVPLRVIAIRPAGGALIAPLLAALPGRRRNEKRPAASASGAAKADGQARTAG